MRTHKKCYWCNKEIQQTDLKLSQKIGHPIHEKCWENLGKMIEEAGFK